MLAIILFLVLLTGFSHAKVFVSQWQDAVTPLMVDYIKRSLEKVEKEGGTLFILELNTPGGLESSMREVIQEFQRTSIPVVVYVSPPGGRAASAGAIITVSADVAVMAPGTNIGAATPVQMGGEKMDEAMREKVMQDMLAFVRSIAKEKGRNPKIIERMVKEAISLTPEEALKEKVIDFIAVDRADLLKKLEGRVVKKHGKEITLKTEGVQVVEIGKSLREELLRVITNPTLAYMLLLIGFYGIFFELYNPGSIIPGAVGVLKKLEGRVVKKHGKEITLKTEGVQVVEIGKSLREELLRVITNPTLAYMLLLIGFYGIFFELYNPGSIIPGAVGVIALLLGLYGLGIIGINWLGLLLILAGLLLLVLELITPTFGGLALAGAVALALGSFILISPDSPYGDIPLSVIGTMVALTVAFFLFAGRLGLKAQKRRKMLGTEELLGEQGEALTDFVEGKGKVFIHGEIWNAVSDEAIRKGDTIIVEEVRGFVLKVRKA